MTDDPNLTTKLGIGILTYALNSPDTDYEKLAYLMALSHIATNKHQLKLCVIVNDRKNCRPELHDVYDFVLDKPDITKFKKSQDEAIHPMHYEAHLFRITPFAETIKVECDMLFTSDISNWIKHMRQYPICFTNQVYNFNNEPADDSYYRKYINQNLLPNVYNGFMYVRFLRTTAMFFKCVDQIFRNWDYNIKKFRLWEKWKPSTDFAMAMACHYMNDLKFGINPTGIPGFIHAKPYITHKSKKHWHEEMNWSIVNPSTVIVNGVKASWPIHYYDKNFATDEIVKKYEVFLQNKNFNKHFLF